MDGDIYMAAESDGWILCSIYYSYFSKYMIFQEKLS